jgi:hypothetical protein
MNLKRLADTPPWEWPNNARDTLLSALLDPGTRDADRALAAQLAGDFVVMNDAIANALVNTARNIRWSEDVRGSAAIALGPALANADTMRFDDPDDVLISEECFHRTRAALQELYRDPEIPNSVRRDVLEASVHAPDEWHPNAVRQAYVQDDSSWRRTAVFCMSFIPGFEDEILESLRSSDEEVERNAVLAAGDQRVDDAWPHIVALVDSEDTPKAILLAAIDAVVNIRPEEAMEVIGDLADHEDEDIAEAVMDALALVDDFEDEDFEGDDGPDDDKRRS